MAVEVMVAPWQGLEDQSVIIEVGPAIWLAKWLDSKNKGIISCYVLACHMLLRDR